MNQYLIDLEHDMESDVWVASWNFDEGCVVVEGRTVKSALTKFAAAMADWTDESVAADALSTQWASRQE